VRLRAPRIAGVAGGLRARGLLPGDRVLLCLENCGEFVELMFGCWAAGLCAVPANARLHPREVEYIADNSRARLLIATPGLAEALAPLAGTVDTVDAVISTGTAEYDALVTNGENLRPETGNPTDHAWLFCTSGTTGRIPLQVLDSMKDWEWIAEMWCYGFWGFGVRPADIVFFAFSYGTFVGFWGAHYASEKIGCLVLPGGNMTTEARVKQILTMKATVVCSTPTYALRMAQEAKTMGVDLAGSSVKRLILSGEPAGSIPATKRLIEEEEYRKLIVDELQHRLKNKLSTIHAVLHQVLQDQPQVWARIDQRMRALTATDDLISRVDGSGCDIKDLLLSELGPYGHIRFTLNGNPLFLPAKLAVSLALIFHELATNAGKYGAFSSARGLLQVSWSVSGDRLNIAWDETEGPQVASVGEAGFGTKLLKSALTPFDGKSEITFLKTGVHCTMQCRIPLI